MNMTDEQIDTAIAALQAMKAARPPLEFWVVVDCDGDRSTYDHKASADGHIAGGGFGPYTLHHMREVLP